MSKKFTQDELNRLGADKGFNEIVDKDPELDRLLNERKCEQSDEDIETLIVLGESCRIAGKEYPAPCMAVFSFLEAIDSPFLVNGEIKIIDIERLLYILKYREKAVGPIIEMKRIQRAIDMTFDRIIENSGLYQIYINAQRDIAKLWSEFDANVAKFAITLGCYDCVKAVEAIKRYLDVCYNGFAMLPEQMKSDKKKDDDLTQIG